MKKSTSPLLCSSLLLLIALLLSLQATAEPLSVSTLRITEQSSYQVERIYGGQLKHRRESNIGFETGGTIHQVHVQEGDRVTAGQVLITLDQASINAELRGAMAQATTAQANVQALQAQLTLANITLKRNQELAREGHISSQLLDEIDQQQQISSANLSVAQAQLDSANANSNMVQVRFDKTVLRAPYDAIVQARNVDEGSIIGPGTAVLNLVENGKIEAVVGIPQHMVHLLVGQETFEFTVNRKQVVGRLKTILPRVDERTGTVTSIFTLDGGSMYAGSLAEMHLSVAITERGYWIPLTALSESQRGLWSVLVVETPQNQSTVESRLVEIIHRGKNAVYVRGTLDDGDIIINSGTGRVVPGQSVQVTNQISTFLPEGN